MSPAFDLGFEVTILGFRVIPVFFVELCQGLCNGLSLQPKVLEPAVYMVGVVPVELFERIGLAFPPFSSLLKRGHNRRVHPVGVGGFLHAPRMAGVKLPAMSSAGSGNHGLTAVLPIWAVKDYVECDPDTVIEAICLSHILTAYVKAQTGRLSAVCGCSVAAGAGATAGITYLLGGDMAHISGAIKNLTEDLAGVICDGAKAGCSLKLSTAAGTAVQAALFSLQGVFVKPTDGIIGQSPEQTMQNIGTLSTEGMIETDRTILNIMLNKF